MWKWRWEEEAEEEEEEWGWIMNGFLLIFVSEDGIKYDDMLGDVLKDDDAVNPPQSFVDDWVRSTPVFGAIFQTRRK